MTRRYQRRRNRRIWMMKRCAAVVASVAGVILIAYLAISLIDKVKMEKITLEGHWVVNGGEENIFTGDFPADMVLSESGTGQVDGLNANWSEDGQILYVQVLWNRFEYKYEFSGEVLLLEDSSGTMFTYSHPGSANKGYNPPEISADDAKTYMGSLLDDYNAQIKYEEMVSKKNLKQYNMTITRVYDYGTLKDTCIVSAKYNPVTLLWDWEYEIIDRISDLDVIGKWKYSGISTSLDFDIYDYDMEDGKIYYSYKFCRLNEDISGSGTLDLNIAVESINGLGVAGLDLTETASIFIGAEKGVEVCLGMFTEECTKQ